LAREISNKESNNSFVRGSCLGFVGIGCHGHLLKGIEDVVFGHSIYLPFIKGRGIVFVLANVNPEKKTKAGLN